MRRPPLANAVQSVDRHGLGRRNELRFVVSEEIARLSIRTAAAHLSVARDDRPYQWSTTTYCDTYDWSSYRAAEAGETVQLRFREYHRTRPVEILGGARAWIELKDDVEDTSSKERFAVAPRVIPAFLRGEAVLSDEGDELVARASALVGGGARPVLATQYNRIAYAGPNDRIRVTADHNLMYLAVPWDSNDDDAVPRRLGPVLGRESDVVLEMKWHEELPIWARDLLEWLRQHSPDRRPSKFIIGMRHLLGGHEERAS